VPLSAPTSKVSLSEKVPGWVLSIAPEVYMRVVADLLPKEANINVEAGEAFVNLWRKISDGLGDQLVAQLDDDQPDPVRH